MRLVAQLLCWLLVLAVLCLQMILDISVERLKVCAGQARMEDVHTGLGEKGRWAKLHMIIAMKYCSRQYWRKL